MWYVRVSPQGAHTADWESGIVWDSDAEQLQLGPESEAEADAAAMSSSGIAGPPSGAAANGVAARAQLAAAPTAAAATEAWQLPDSIRQG